MISKRAAARSAGELCEPKNIDKRTSVYIPQVGLQYVLLASGLSILGPRRPDVRQVHSARRQHRVTGRLYDEGPAADVRDKGA
jgi:hypothetical protein